MSMDCSELYSRDILLKLLKQYSKDDEYDYLTVVVDRDGCIGVIKALPNEIEYLDGSDIWDTKYSMEDVDGNPIDVVYPEMDYMDDFCGSKFISLKKKYDDTIHESVCYSLEDSEINMIPVDIKSDTIAFIVSRRDACNVKYNELKAKCQSINDEMNILTKTMVECEVLLKALKGGEKQ